MSRGSRGSPNPRGGGRGRGGRGGASDSSSRGNGGRGRGRGGIGAQFVAASAPPPSMEGIPASAPGRGRWVNRGTPGAGGGMRGGFRGRGRGGFVKADHTNAAFDYTRLDSTKLGYDSPAPPVKPPSFQYVGVPPAPRGPQASTSTSEPIPSHFLPPSSTILSTPAPSPPPSGAATPHYGIGSAGDRFSQNHAFNQNQTKGPATSGHSSRGGFGYARPQRQPQEENSWYKEDRPYLRPIKFVKATVALPSTTNEELSLEVKKEREKAEKWEPARPGLGEKILVVQGQHGKEAVWGEDEVRGQRETESQGAKGREWAEGKEEETKRAAEAGASSKEKMVVEEQVKVDVEVATVSDFHEPMTEDLPVLLPEPSPPLSSEQRPSFIFDSTPAPAVPILFYPPLSTTTTQTITKTTTTSTASPFVLGLTSTPPAGQTEESESDSDEQIVFRAPNLISRTKSPHSVTSSAPTKAKEPQVVLPKAKMTKGQKKQLKKEGKKARKSGKAHQRSGNRHVSSAKAGQVESDDEDSEENEEAGIELFSKMNLSSHGMEVDVVDSGPDDDELDIPREGSDIEWGDNGPPPPRGSSSALPTGKARRNERRLQRMDQKEKAKMERLASKQREEVERELEREEEALMGGGSRVKKTRKELAQEDYEANVRQFLEEEGMDATALQFAANVVGDPYGGQDTIEDLENDASWAAGQWETESESEVGSDFDSQSDGLDTEERDIMMGLQDAADELILQRASEPESPEDSDDSISTSSSAEDEAIEEALLAGHTIRFSSQGQKGPGGRHDLRARKRASKGKGRSEESEFSLSVSEGGPNRPTSDSGSQESDSEISTEDESEESGMFEGRGGTWADKDERVIRGVQRIIEENADLLAPGNRKARKQLFKNISQGDFEGYDFEDDDYGLSKKRTKGHKGPQSSAGTSDSHFVDHLQGQWEKDRQKKASFKRERALARAQAAALSASSKSGKGKKSSKSSSAYSQSKGAEHDPWSAWNNANSDEEVVDVTDAQGLQLRIYKFVAYQHDAQSLSLPPMSKKMRVVVHLLSEVYGLRSDSKGKGDKRFPVLTKTGRTNHKGIDRRRIELIVGTAGGEIVGAGRHSKGSGGRTSSLWKVLQEDGKGKRSGAGGSGGGAGKNREGAVVGQGADKIGEGNIGFALLKKMGWTEGGQIGVSGGMMDPIVARVKTNKQGLGSGFIVSRAEAQIMGTAPEAGWH